MNDLTKNELKGLEITFIQVMKKFPFVKGYELLKDKSEGPILWFVLKIDFNKLSEYSDTSLLDGRFLFKDWDYNFLSTPYAVQYQRDNDITDPNDEEVNQIRDKIDNVQDELAEFMSWFYSRLPYELSIMYDSSYTMTTYKKEMKPLKFITD
jgi:hypothetical protein